ncbi:Flp pilus assembly protein CpaB [Domibacillus sp. PGB-M46]|uniref:Flp pilus assembly protein CpaB n=1 Tax=Domibacillus sp. PGB-M46 TaxID=2910255 RepID=UPI001F5A0946|nr:Flp pilus assembly protein CpaB [Domibacillus sp. PGB-M46]MCI2257068.1 Flp pilus assembly protein CpaB [Domibacillus sp. PGB-M46]
MKTRRLVFLAIISGLITTMLFYVFLKKEKEETAGPPVSMVKAVQAVQDIEKNEKITEENITTIEIPEDQLHPETVQDPQTILGKHTSANLKQGEIIMQHRIQKVEEEAKVVSRKIKEGYRAVSISTDYVKAVSNLIEPEDFVDVVLIEQPLESAPKLVNTELILEKVKVLSVGKRMVEKGEVSEEAKEGAEPEYSAVTLELNQYDSIKLINASARGGLQLILHSRLSTKKVNQNKDSLEETLEKAPGGAQFLPVPKRSIIRAKPHLNAHVITVVKEDTELIFLGDQRRDEEDRLWFRVETPDGNQGWISSQKGE